MTVSNGDAFACTVLAQNDEVLSGCKLSLVSISGVPVSLDENGNIVATEAGEAVVMVRLDNTLDINGWDLSSLSSTDYAIYSTPITIMQPSVPNAMPIPCRSKIFSPMNSPSRIVRTGALDMIMEELIAVV